MNKRVVLSIGLAALLATSVFAKGGNCDADRAQYKMSHKCDNSPRGKKGGFLMSAIMKLDLSDEQKQKIGSIMKEKMRNMPRISEAFSEKSLDKEKLMKILKEKQDNKLQRRADIIASVYDVLTPSQRQELKEILDKRASY